MMELLETDKAAALFRKEQTRHIGSSAGIGYGDGKPE